jgi:hypothetical protein
MPQKLPHVAEENFSAEQNELLNILGSRNKIFYSALPKNPKS